MIRYEMKKIFSKNVSKISLVVLLIPLIVFCYFAISDVRYVDERGNAHSGITAARSLRAEKQKWEGYVTADVLQKVIDQNNRINEEYPYNPNTASTQNEINYSKKQGFSDIKEMINSGFSEFRSYDYYRVNTVSRDEVSKLYENRESNLIAWLNSDEAKDEFSEEEKFFLVEQYRKMEVPLYYKDADGWKAALTYAQTIVMLTMLICTFLVSGIFSDEFSWKSDAIFFSTRYGRDRGTNAKLIAGIIVITGIYWLVMMLYSLIVLGCLGFKGGEVMIQAGFFHWKSFYNITHLQLYVLTVTSGYIGTIFCLFLSMLVSAKSHSAVVATVIPFAILFLPSFVSDFHFLAGILGIFPARLLQLNEVVSTFDLYQIGDKVIGSIPIMLVIYPILSVLMVPFMYHIYHNTKIR